MKKVLLTSILSFFCFQSLYANPPINDNFVPADTPLARSTPPKPNIYLILDDSGSMSAADMTIHGDQIRRDVALQIVVKDLINKYRNDAYIGFGKLGSYGFGGSQFPNPNAVVPLSDLKDESTYNNAITKVDNIVATGRTPLSHPLYDAGRLFRGEGMLSGGNLKNPTVNYQENYIKYRCQAQHIILLTDGGANEYNMGPLVERDDLYFKDRESGYITVKRRGSGTTTNFANGQLVEQKNYSGDRIGPSYTRSQETMQVGQFLWDLDLLTDSQVLGDFDAAGKAWDDFDIWGARPGIETYDDQTFTDSEGNTHLKPRMPIHVDAITFGDSTSTLDQGKLDKTVEPSGGVHVLANDTSDLDKAFNDIFQRIIQTQSGTGSVETQADRSAGALRYHTLYDSRGWSGTIVAYEYDSATGGFNQDNIWRTDQTIKPYQGDFYTYNSGTVKFGNGTEGVALSGSGIAENYAKWLQGDDHIVDSNDVRIFRYRGGNYLGAIINSDIIPFSTDRPYINLEVVGNSKNTQDRFFTYINKRAVEMPYNYLIGGSNDGLINFLIADKNGNGEITSKAGERAISYFPSFFKDDLAEITSVDYTHKYKVDGKTQFFDAYITNSAGSNIFTTLGITTMAAGGKGLVGYQLFKTDGDGESNPSSDFNINFEIFNKDNTGDFKNLGYTYSEMGFVNQKTSSGKERAVAIFGNGPGGIGSSLFMIDAVTGDFIKEIVLNSNGKGAASPAVVTRLRETTDLQEIETIYVGTYDGELYRISFSRNDNNHLESATPEITKLFDTGGTEHPISVRPTVAINPEIVDDVWVYFGTGLATTEEDISNDALETEQAFYGIRDLKHLVTKDDLVEQSIIEVEETERNAEGELVGTTNGRKELNLVTSHNVQKNGVDAKYIDYETEKGWMMPLVYDDVKYRVIRPAYFYGSKFIGFTTWAIDKNSTKVDHDPCIDADTLKGSNIVLNLYSGNGSSIFINKEGEDDGDGYHLAEDSPGIPTGDDIMSSNIYDGSYFRVVSLAMLDKLPTNSYYAGSRDKVQNFIQTSPGNLLSLVLKEAVSVNIWTVFTHIGEKGNFFEKEAKSPYEVLSGQLRGGGRLYLKHR